jgi:hypothetical protein
MFDIRARFRLRLKKITELTHKLTLSTHVGEGPIRSLLSAVAGDSLVSRTPDGHYSWRARERLRIVNPCGCEQVGGAGCWRCRMI